MITKEDIKFAEIKEIPQIVALGFASFKENQLADVCNEPDFDKATEAVAECVIKHVTLVARKDGKVAGVLMLVPDQLWFGNEVYMRTLLFYVKQEHRSFTMAKALLQAAQEYVIINDIPLVFDLFAQKDVQKKIKLLKRLGFTDCGTNLVFKSR